MVTQVKKDEDEMDVDEEKNDVIGFQHHTSSSKGKRCITTEESFINLGGFKRAATMKKRNASPKRGKNNAMAKKRDVSEEESDISSRRETEMSERAVPRRESPWGLPEGDTRQPKPHRCNDRAEDVIQVIHLPP
nr:putative B3 domain-containing protein At5g66980 [Ipomoea batatas]